jgi:hypothetical protein
LKAILKDPEGFKRMVTQEAELIAKYGKEKYNEVLVLAAEAAKKDK